jgi:transmembrane 9 superfamily member 2/4
LDGAWNDKNTRLATCDPHANKVVIGSDTPQEVEAGKEIIFTYDVGFEVISLVTFHLLSCTVTLLLTDEYYILNVLILLAMALQESDIKWASRWDTYLLMTDD